MDAKRVGDTVIVDEGGTVVYENMEPIVAWS